MADQKLSWRRPPGHTNPVSQKNVYSKSDSRAASNWRNRGPAGGTHQSSHSRESSVAAPTDSVGSQAVKETENGPAAPLHPLMISSSRPLPHPNNYSGADNWALTPTSSVPSLPATPSRAMQMMGWNHIALPEEERTRDSSGSRELSAARAVLNRRNEDNSGVQPRTLSPHLPQALARQSPKRQPGQLSSSPAIKSPTSAGFFNNVRPVSPSEALYASTSGLQAGQHNSPSLRHRDSSTSVASSGLRALGVHPLSHSRRASQVFLNSPASSVNSSAIVDRPGYRVYRPPHLRRKDSIHALKPKVAHYDRVRTPSLRGQSRSPDFNSLLPSRNSQDGSGTPSDTASVSASRPAGARRLSSLGAYHTSIYDELPSSPNRGVFDTRSLIAKLAANKLRKQSDASSHRPEESNDQEDLDRESDVAEDFDLSVEDLMMEANSLTDEFCMSRTGSSEVNRPVVDVFQIGDRLGPGMMHDGLEITIAETSEGFRDQSADLTGSQLEVIKQLGEGSYAVVYLVKEVHRTARAATTSENDQPEDGAVGIPRSAQAQNAEEGDETVMGSDDLDIYSTTLKATKAGHLLTEEMEGEVQNEETRFFALKCLCKRDLSDEMLQVQRLEATIHQSIPKHPHIVTLHRTYETAEWLFLILEYCPGQDLFFWLEQANDTNNLDVVTPALEGQKKEEAKFFEEALTMIDSTPPSPSLLASTASRHLLSSRRLRLISRLFQQMCEAIAFCHSRGISHRDIKPENFIVEDTRETGAQDSIKVKLTDFGLAVAQEQCIDFDCGSKPYMSYECRNNRTRWYDPKQSDVWSLGIVLLNLIFHRNPFAEPHVDKCPSFGSYVEDPVRFLTSAFRGLKWSAAEFLAENVFCDVTEALEDGSGPSRKRISAQEFGVWASNLSDHMELSSELEKLSLQLGADQEITSPIEQARSASLSLASSLRASPHSGMHQSMSSIQQELAGMGIPEEEWKTFGSLFPEDTKLAGSVPASGVPSSEEEVAASSMLEPTVETHKEDTDAGIPEGEEGEDPVSIDPPPLSAATTSPGNPKRRKRGARKGRTMTKQELKRSQSVGNFSSHKLEESSRDKVLRELAEASQTLAREMSKAMKDARSAPDVKVVGLAKLGESPPSDTASTLYSSAASVSRGSVASTQYTTFSWPDSNAPRVSTSSLANPTAAVPARKERFTALRPGTGLPAAPIMTNWRDKDDSTSSFASSSLYSDVASIYSTASAPAAFAARQHHRNSSNAPSSLSSPSSSATNVSAPNKHANIRGTLATASNLDTITERVGEKKLDASYLAEIFGGRAPGGYGKEKARGLQGLAQEKPVQQASSTPHKEKQQQQQHHPSHLPYAREAGIKNGAMASFLGGSTSANSGGPISEGTNRAVSQAIGQTKSSVHGQAGKEERTESNRAAVMGERATQEAIPVAVIAPTSTPTGSNARSRLPLWKRQG